MVQEKKDSLGVLTNMIIFISGWQTISYEHDVQMCLR